MSDRRAIGASLLTLAFLAVIAIFTRSTKSSATPDVVPRPLPQAEVLEFSGRETHRFRVDLKQDECLRVEVLQKGVDVRLALSDVDGKEILDFDNPGGAYSTERLAFIAAHPGQYVVSVSPASGSLRTRRYEIRSQIGPSTAFDHDETEAYRNLFNADRQQKKRTPAGLHRARHLYRGSEDEWAELNRPHQAVIASIRSGQTWEFLKHPDEGARSYQRGLALLETIGDSPEKDAQIADLSIRLGEVYRHLLRSREAQEVLLEGLESARKLGDQSSEASLLNGLGLIAARRGNREEALRLYGLALPLFENVERPRAVCQVLINIAQTHVILGQQDEAIEFYQRAEALGRRSGDPKLVLRAMHGLAWARHRKGDSLEAIEIFDRMIDIAESIKAHDSLIDALSSRGVIYYLLERHEEAQRDLLRGLNLIGKQGSVLRGYILVHLGRTTLDLGRREEALDYIRQAREIENDDPIVRFTTLFLRARALHALDQPDRALEDVEKALKILETYRSNLQSDGLRMNFLEPRQEYYDQYIDILMDLADRHGKEYEIRAFIASERTRARLLLELLKEGDSKIRQGLSQDLIERSQNLLLEVVELENERQSLAEEKNADPLAVERIEEKQQDLSGRYFSLQKELEQRNPEYIELTQPKELTLDQVQNDFLDSGTTLLTYYLGEKRSFLWRVTKDDFETYELQSGREIESQARHLYGYLKKGDRPQHRVAFDASAKKISESLLGKVYDKLEGQRLVVVTSGALQYIPFAMLPIPSGKKRLIVQHEISSLPSVAVLKFLQKPAVKPTTILKVALIADPVFSVEDERLQVSPRADERPAPPPSMYRRLPYSKEEAESISSLLESSQVYLAYGFDASRETVLSGRLKDYDVVHFATHGHLEDQNPELIRIVLSQVDRQGQPVSESEGFLSLYDIYNLDLPSEMVVLSACRTALGQEINGEGIVGLTRGFMYAGASRVLVSLWDINDKATSELMKRFYTALIQEGQRPVAALRSAQKSMIDDQQYNHPFYWAPFILQGDWR